MVVGIIGKVGSGKSACAEYLEKKYKAIVFSCDHIAKEIIENKDADYIALPSGLFFRSKEAQEECRNKIHKLVFDKICKDLKNIKNKNNFNNCEEQPAKMTEESILNKYNLNNFCELVVIECALPSERLFEMCDKVIYIRNSYGDKVKLLYEKRGYTEDVTKLIYDSQAYYDKYYDRADIVIDNNGTKSDLEKKIKEVIDEIYIVRK